MYSKQQLLYPEAFNSNLSTDTAFVCTVAWGYLLRSSILHNLTISEPVRAAGLDHLNYPMTVGIFGSQQAFLMGKMSTFSSFFFKLNKHVREWKKRNEGKSNITGEHCIILLGPPELTDQSTVPVAYYYILHCPILVWHSCAIAKNNESYHCRFVLEAHQMLTVNSCVHLRAGCKCKLKHWRFKHFITRANGLNQRTGGGGWCW